MIFLKTMPGPRALHFAERALHIFCCAGHMAPDPAEPSSFGRGSCPEVRNCDPAPGAKCLPSHRVTPHGLRRAAQYVLGSNPNTMRSSLKSALFVLTTALLALAF